ncbi:helix-turn-helix transcriptional regulator [Azohydromonas sediminis]|uniref:helix-turn-helix transcriptional regulator n=1 Tax=Azohydromonas sediminis TaxID=2259674 RepID=UPI000E6558B6|nr:helix-turn-helix transcriptional regulator [Azohydromonas sediminis]
MTLHERADDRATGGSVRDSADGSPAATVPEATSTDFTQALARWLFDRIDVGALWLGDGGVVGLANTAALEALSDHPVLALQAGRLTARREADRQQLRRAMTHAVEQGGTVLVRLDACGEAGHLALQALERCGGRASWVCLLPRPRPASRLAVQLFAQDCALTAAEAEILWRLCEGHRPREIAALQGVAASTVRTQIRAVRAKTGCPTIRALIESLARLPPLHGADPEIARTLATGRTTGNARGAWPHPIHATVSESFPAGTTPTTPTTPAHALPRGVAVP